MGEEEAEVEVAGPMADGELRVCEWNKSMPQFCNDGLVSMDTASSNLVICIIEAFCQPVQLSLVGAIVSITAARMHCD